VKGEIEKKNQFKKAQNIIKRMRTKLKNIIYEKLGLNDGIEIIQNFYKKVRNKN